METPKPGPSTSPSAIATARWRDRHRDELNARRAERRRECRAAVAAIKEASPCADCGQHFPSVCMDFDHLGDDKTANIARLVADIAMPRILAEIAKCELVCANCHRLRTSRRAHDRSPAA